MKYWREINLSNNVRPHVKEFLNYIEVYKNVEENTIKNYKIDMDWFFQYTSGEIPLDVKTLTAYTNYLLKEKGDKRSTIRRRLSSLKSYYNYLYDEELINVDVAKKIKYIKADPQAELEVMSKKDIFKILNGIVLLRDKALLELIYSTGIREGECSNLQIEHINFEHQFIAIIRTKGNKSKKPRLVPTSERALKYVKAYMGVRKEGPLFLNQQARKLSTRSIYNICMRHFNLPPHHLRHAFATHMIAETGNTKAVADMLGHANEKMTEKYVHLAIDNLQYVYKKGGMEK
jgi:site-specific recombinase XerD